MIITVTVEIKAKKIKNRVLKVLKEAQRAVKRF